MLGALLALVLAVASVQLAFARDHPDADGGQVQVIDLTTRTLQSADINEGAPGPSVGDRSVFSDDVFRDGVKVGTDGGDCVLVQVTPGATQNAEPQAATAQCTATVKLPEGQITAQGLVDFISNEPFTIAITGGTGQYRTAHGEVRVTQESEEVSTLRLTVIL
jgi:hypothetical protein